MRTIGSPLEVEEASKRTIGSPLHIFFSPLVHSECLWKNVHTCTVLSLVCIQIGRKVQYQKFYEIVTYCRFLMCRVILSDTTFWQLYRNQYAPMLLLGEKPICSSPCIFHQNPNSMAECMPIKTPVFTLVICQNGLSVHNEAQTLWCILCIQERCINAILFIISLSIQVERNKKVEKIFAYYTFGYVVLACFSFS